MLEKIKWTATLSLVFGVGGVAAGFYYFIFAQLFGCVLWLIASYWMKDKALLTNNIIMVSICVLGIFYKILFLGV